MAPMTESTAISVLVRRWLRRLVFVAGGVAALALVAWLAVPPIVRAQLESRLTAELGRPTTIESVKFNPFALRVDIFNLVVAGPAGEQPVLAIDALVANFSSASFWHRAPVLNALT
jgi:hypothetical protein